MRIALAVLALGACSKAPAHHRPTFDEITKRVGGACEDRGTFRTCKTSTVEVSVSHDDKDTATDPRVFSFTLHVRTPTGDAAVTAVEPILDGIVPPEIIDGIRTRWTGPRAEVFDVNKHVTIDKVQLTAGTAIIGDPPPVYEADIWYW